jgi:hypothetical protein
VVRLHAGGWSVKSIASYLGTARSTVYRALRRWIEEGLDDRPNAGGGVRKADLKAYAAVRRLQENPNLGEFRIHAALARMGIQLSLRTCGRILVVNRKLYSTSRGGWPTGTSRKPRAGQSSWPPTRGGWRASTRRNTGRTKTGPTDDARPGRCSRGSRGRCIGGEQLDRAFFSERFVRVLNPLGYTVWRRWKVYGEEGLAGREAALWLREKTLTIEHAGEPLSRYEVEFADGTGKPRALSRPVLFESTTALPQPKLFGLDSLGEGGWLKALRLEDYAPRRPRAGLLQQALFPYHEAWANFLLAPFRELRADRFVGNWAKEGV